MTNANNAISARAKRVNEMFVLAQDGKAWVATWLNADGSVFAEISGERCEVIRDAWRRWGHMNFEDESEAFSAIFH